MSTEVANEKLNSELLEIENEIRKLKEKRTNLRRAMPKEEIQDYTFKNLSGEVKLSDLFADKEVLVVIHNMGKGCAYCTLWGDGFNGIIDHLENKFSFIVESKNTPEEQQKFASERNWKLKMYSSRDTSFKQDLGFADGNNNIPGLSVFTKNKDGKIYRNSSTVFGPGDDFCSMWYFLDLLPEEISGWSPKF